LTTFRAGNRQTAAGLNGALGLSAHRASDGTAMTNNTLANEPVLFVPLLASTTYDFELKLFYKGAATGTGDLKLAWSVPSGATLAGSGMFIANPLGVAILYYTQATVSTFSASNGTSNPFGIRLWGTVFMSTTPGNLQLQAAEQTTNATGTTILAGSSLIAVQIS
jgi:hypothetical protein